MKVTINQGFPNGVCGTLMCRKILKMCHEISSHLKKKKRSYYSNQYLVHSTLPKFHFAVVKLLPFPLYYFSFFNMRTRWKHIIDDISFHDGKLTCTRVQQ